MKSFFKRFKKKMPLVNSVNTGYFLRENMFEDIVDLQTILKTGFEAPFSETTKEITFHGVPLKDTSPQVVKKKFGNPNYVLNNTKSIDGHKVFFYRDGIGLYKFLIQYHFINDKFFFACNRVSSITVLSDEDKSKVIGRIKTKYFGEDAKDMKGLKIKLKDPNGSILYTRDDVYYYLNYFIDNETTKQLIDKYSNYKAPTIRPKGLKDSLEEYI